MKAFINTPITKDKLLEHLYEHQRKDAFIRGSYEEYIGEKFKGCAVGCSLQSVAVELGQDIDYEDHSLYESYLGVPQWLAHVEDALFEGVSADRAKKWPVEFIEAINVGSDLDKVKTPFIIFLMEENLKTLDSLDLQFRNKNWWIDCRNCVEQMIKAQVSAERDKIAKAESAAWRAAWRAAESAERRAWRAAESAARVAASAASAAESAAKAAASAERSAERSAAFENYADKLLELIRACENDEA